MTYYLRIFVAAAVLVAAAGCSRKPAVEEAKAFLDGAEAQLLKLSEEGGRAAWVQSTYITDDTEVLAARANQRLIDAVVGLVKESKRFDGVQLPADLARKMKLLKLSLTLAAPADPKESEELMRIAAGMEGAYGKGRACPEGVKDPAKCLDINAVTKVMAESRNPAELLSV
jgi:peptidyl-dipeptidase A